MNLRDFQIIATKAGLYNGGIDGLDGPKSRSALDKVLEPYPTTKNWSTKRRIVAGIQALLHVMDYEPGIVDGYEGHNTNEAFAAFIYERVNNRREEIDRNVLRSRRSDRFPHQRDVTAFYGSPGDEVRQQLVRIQLPFTMRIDWNRSQKVDKITLHRKCAESAKEAFNEIYDVYGIDDIIDLGLDLFAGSYNHRKMRGGDLWSMHAYGCAIDFNASPNGLRTRCPDALFCGQEYVKFFDIWESYGWTSLGRAIGRDWMHVQAADI